ncbi:hypothetical protein M011DRAFT_475919 [Sporormia fimetaria CBS 119925]|uniref:Transcription factor domain-containing protein n=1 Tax=Sporormia fimetaria CBS 119925 TaxID=1340428 RepID=A0A6A6VJ95_9PLEO|nr:hypothetical protein M011DRAFT_475919 [Sporormia fimetaria CBS 119925]
MPDGTPIPSPDTRFYFQDSSCPGVLFAAQPEIYASSTPCSTPLLEPLGAIIPGAVETIEKTEGDLEEILPADWTSHCGFSTSPGSSSSSSDSALKPQPQLSLDSPESLTRYFDRDTCGILSVTDGPTENPWRTLVWPLARVYPALYHAIASMTSFHHSRDSQTFRIQGIEHVRSAVAELAANMGGMHIHAAISTTLALAFAESWDQHISTGNHHIKGAKLMLDEALLQYRRQPSNQAETDRLRFLCNSWLYRDVIARLTSAEGDYSNDFDYYFDVLALDGQEKTRLDPLMGCARTLFPIIGCVANLVRKVRHSGYNDPGILSEAAELKRQLEHWTPPSHIEDPEDETMSVQDSIHTARAYLDATLLYLHQAVPDLPSLSPSILATSVLDALASVGPASRSVIVHIYPLMAAGCEATLPSERNWVRRRWKMLASRMKLGILEKCQIVTEEVWRRRDENALRIGDQKGNATVAKRTRKRRLSSTLEDLESDTLSCWCEDGRKRRVLDGLSGTALSLPTDYHWNEVDSSGDAESDASTQLVPIKQMLIGFNQPFSEGSAFQNAETEFLDPDFTVTGRLHWLGVMTEWKWEIFLG